MVKKKIGKISTSVDGWPSGGSHVRRPGSKDPIGVSGNFVGCCYLYFTLFSAKYATGLGDSLEFMTSDMLCNIGNVFKE